MGKIIASVKKKPKLLVGAVVFLCLLGLSLKGCDKQTIVVIDTVKLQDNAGLYQQLDAEKEKYLEKEKQSFEREKEVLVQKDKALLKRWEKLPKKVQKSSAKNPLKKEVDALRSQIVDLQERYQAKIERIEKTFEQAKINMHQQAVNLVAKWGKTQGYTLILPKHLTLFSTNTVDKTEQFIRWLNKNGREKIVFPTPEEMELEN